MSRFYFAHKITTRHYVRDNICPALHKAGIETINPFYASDGSFLSDRPEVKAIDAGRRTEYGNFTKTKSKDIVEKDLEKIRNADGLIAYIEQSSIGTSMEVFYCARWCKKPVFVLTTSYNSHPWLVYYAKISGGKIVTSLRALIRAIKTWERENNER